MYVRTKNKQIIQFRPNGVQIQFLNEHVPGWKNDDYTMRDVKGVLLKARQQGFSTLIAALFFIDTVNNPNTKTVQVAHDEETTILMFEVVTRFYEHLPEHKKPPLARQNEGLLRFAHNGSSYFVGWAGSKNFGRSQTINNLHGSEVAFWPDGEKLASGLMQAVPLGGNAILESTANGRGNFFHDEFWRGYNGESSYFSLFVPWFLSEDYQVDPEAPGTHPFTDPDDIEDERNLINAFNLNDRQIAWRRLKMREPGMKKKFQVEYPSTPEEAFETSGVPYFDKKLLIRITTALHGADRKPLHKPKTAPMRSPCCHS